MFVIFLSKYFISKMVTDKQHGVVGKTTLYREFGYKAVCCGPRFSAAGGNAKWACLNLLRIALTILKKQVNNVNDNERLSIYIHTYPIHILFGLQAKSAYVLLLASLSLAL